MNRKGPRRAVSAEAREASSRCDYDLRWGGARCDCFRKRYVVRLAASADRPLDQCEAARWAATVHLSIKSSGHISCLWSDGDDQTRFIAQIPKTHFDFLAGRSVLYAASWAAPVDSTLFHKMH